MPRQPMYGSESVGAPKVQFDMGKLFSPAVAAPY